MSNARLMAVPKFDILMRPLLTAASDGREFRLADAAPSIAKELKLSEADLAEQIPSGASRFRNRIYWAKLYLSQAKALDTVRPGVFRITDRGRDLARRLSVITPDDLMVFSEFREFKARRDTKSASKSRHKTYGTGLESPDPGETPEDAIEAAYSKLKSAVVREILDALQAADPIVLSSIMVKVLVSMGYGDEESGVVLDGVGDGGVDGVVNRDRLGLSRVYIQAKRYKTDNKVGAPAIQQFAGSMDERRANEGVFVTTSDFSEPALNSASKLTKRIALINGERLAEIMFELGVGVTTEKTYHVRRVNTSFFTDS